MEKKGRRTLLLTISEINDKDTALEADKVNNNKTHVAVVTVCLTPNHSQCTGAYEDSLTGRYVVRCICRCGHLQLPSNKNNSGRGPADQQNTIRPTTTSWSTTAF